MKITRHIVPVLFILIVSVILGISQKKQEVLSKKVDFDYSEFIDANRIKMYVTNYGIFGRNIGTGNSGLEFPRGSGKTALFTAGPFIGGKVNGEIRLAVACFSSEFVPGPLLHGTFQEDVPEFRVYKIYSGDNGSNPDWLNWPVDQGAPVNADGTPRLIGEQTLWSVFNDANPDRHTSSRGGTLPLGIEVKNTVFAFDKPLDNSVFIQYEIANKSEHVIDSTYFMLWTDPDLGDAFNDLIGVDRERNLGFCYDSDNNDGVYVEAKAAIGFDVLEGITDDSGNEVLLSSFPYFSKWQRYNPLQVYNIMKGLEYEGTPIINDVTGKETKFIYDGDPVTNTGWNHYIGFDKRLVMNSGPFTMQPGDVQQVLYAIVLAEGEDRLEAVTNLRYHDDIAQAAYNVGFEVPEKVPVPDVEVVALDEQIILYWDDSAENYTSAGYVFEGYNVYRSESINVNNSANLMLIQSFDIENDVLFRLEDIFDTDIQLLNMKNWQEKPNAGVLRFLRINRDYPEPGSDGEEFINGNHYYFVVTAFVQNKNSPFKILESERIVLDIVPSLPSPGTDYSGAYENTDSEARHVSGNAERAKVTIDVINPLELTGVEYSVTFSEENGETVWNLSRGNTEVLTGQTNFSGDYNYPFIEGLFVRVKGIRQIKTYSESELDRGTNSDLSLKGDAMLYGCPDGRASHIWGGGENAKKYLWHDLRIDFPGSATSGQYATEVTDFGDPNSVSSLKRVPWVVMNNENFMYLNAAYYDNEPQNGKWDIESGDPIIVIDSPYEFNKIHKPDDPNATWMLVFDPKTMWQKSDSYYVRYDNYFIPGEDKFTFKTASVLVDNDSLKQKTFNEKIRAVPNPYYRYSLYENGWHERRVKFTPLPEKCTIRIFNLAGVLIRTIYKDDFCSFTFWDLKNEYNTPVSSGIYVYVVESKELGQAIGKMALFMESRY